jgi:hypothetical protein
MNIEQLKIVIKTAIPGKDRIELKRDVLYLPDNPNNPSELNDYPFIVANQLLNQPALQDDYYLYGYYFIVNFFFNKKTFIQYSSKYLFPEPTFDAPETNEQMKERQKKNLSQNVKMMLELLFPMSYPASLNISDSFSTYIKQNINFDLNTVLSNVSKNIIKTFSTSSYSTPTNTFSYLKIDGTVYTITKVTWLNDLLNHPIYRDFINEYISFNQYSDQQSELLDSIVTDKTKQLFERIKESEEDPMSLNIYREFLGKFIDNLKKYIDSNVKKTTGQTQKVTLFISNVTNIIVALLEIYNLHQNPQIKTQVYRDYFATYYKYVQSMNAQTTSAKKIKPPSTLPAIDFNKPKNYDNLNDSAKKGYISQLTIHVNDLNKFYSATEKSDSESLSGISSAFSSRINKIIAELKVINTTKVIKEKYINENPIMNLSGEDQDVIDELKTNFSAFMTFIEKIKELLPPNRSSTNKELQDRIIEYSKSKSNKSSNPVSSLIPSFNDLIKTIQVKYIQGSLPEPNIDAFTQELIKTEVCELDKRKQELPHYEIFIGVNLIEGEFKSDNVNDVKCIYRGMYLGKETQHFFTKYNKYDINQHLFFLSQKEIKEQREENTINPPLTSNVNNALPPLPPPPTNAPEPPQPPLTLPPPLQSQGGSRKRKIYIKKTRKNKYYKVKSKNIK